MSGTLSLRLGVDQRMALLGRIRMAEWMEMKEADFAREIERIEKDALFRRLLSGAPDCPALVRRRPWSSGWIRGGWFEFQEDLLAGKQDVPVEAVLNSRAALLPKIREIGLEAFTRHFLYGSEVSDQDLMREFSLSRSELDGLRDLILEVDVAAEFCRPGRDPRLARSYSRVARLEVENGVVVFAFDSARWARGLYGVRYDLLERWKRERLEPRERARLRPLLKRLETVNMRQNTMHRIFSELCRLQAPYLARRRDEDLCPVSLRQLAHRLALCPSTVCRAVAGRSVELPWGEEAPIIELLPGRRRVLRLIVAGLLARPGGGPRDPEIAKFLLREHGIRVARRTVNAVRHEVLSGERAGLGGGR